MVVFTCNNCGDSVKKPKVDKHISFECKKKKYAAASLCCIDCLVNFNSDTYAAHTKCVTEEERYSAQGFVPKPSSNNGERKQNLWIDVVRSVLNRKDLTKFQRQLLETISNFENVPRKKIKFQNFVKSSVRNPRPSPQVIDHVFDILEKEFKNNAPVQVNQANKKEAVCDEPKENDTENGSGNNDVIEEGSTDPSSEKLNGDGHDCNSKNKNHEVKNEENETLNNIHAGEEANDDPSATNDKSDDHNSFEVVKKKKKKKNKLEENTKITIKEAIEVNTENENNKRPLDEETIDDNFLNNKQISKKKKKKLKLQAELNTTSPDNDDLNETCDNGIESTNVEPDIFQQDSVNETSVDVISNNEDNNFLNNKQISKKKKKKLKLQAELHTTSPDNDDLNETCDNGMESTNVEPDIFQQDSVNETSVDVISNNEECTRTLTKKEKKEKKKKLKYENALRAIELENKEQMNVSEIMGDEKACVEKKLKNKRKLTEKKDDVEEISIKKIKYSENVKNNENEDVQNNSNKFDWEIIVKTLLEKSDDGEISLKKMTKKVVQEYQNIYGNSKTYDEIAKKLNKKLKQLPFAVVFKERVKLCL